MPGLTLWEHLVVTRKKKLLQTYFLKACQKGLQGNWLRLEVHIWTGITQDPRKKVACNRDFHFHVGVSGQL